MSQQQKPSSGLKEGLLNLDDIILQHAESLYERLERKDLEKALGVRLPWSQLRTEIDTCELLVHTAAPSYATDHADASQEAALDTDEVPIVTGGAGDKTLRPATSHSCVFRTVYTNACQHEVVNSINTTRTTRASCSFRATRALVLQKQLGLKLALPKDILEFNVGFSSEVSMEQEAEKAMETEISWSVNTEVRVPGCPDPGAKASRVTAEIVIEEKEFRARFTAVTQLSGRIKVRVYTKDDRHLVNVSMPNIRKVFTQELGFLHPRDGGAVSKVAFVSAGYCHSRFGVSQTVNITPAE